MSAINLTLEEVNKTCLLIVSDSHRKLKQSLADYHDVNSAYSRDMEYCRNQFNQITNAGSERLQGLVFLFLGNEQLTAIFEKYQIEILDDRKLFGSLLIAGQHFNQHQLLGAA